MTIETDREPTVPATSTPPWLDSRSGAAASVVLVLAASLGAGYLNPILGIPAALLVVWVLSWSAGWGWADLGFRRPVSWTWTVVGALLFAAVMQLLSWKVLLPLLEWAGVELPDFSSFAAIRGNLPMLLMYLGVSWTTAGFGEEIIWRGFLLPRTARLLGESRAGWAAALLLTSVGFGFLHFYQGITGIVLTGVIGFFLGAIYLVAGKNLWPAILAHGAMDTIAFLLLYMGWFDPPA